MRRSIKWWSALLGPLLVTTAARATTSDPAMDRYHAIPERNAFGLEPRQEPPPQAAATKPLRKLLLTGITTLMGTKRALLKAEPLAGQKDAKEQSMILTEGQREDEIEVVRIDEHAGRVTVDNSGTLMTLSFEKDAPKLPNAAPATHGVPVPGVPQPAALPAPVPSATGRLFSRRWPMNNAAAPTAPAPAANPATPPAPPVPGTPPATTGTTSITPQDLTPEEQAIVNELRQQATQTDSNTPAIPPDTTVPANPAVTAPSLAPPGLKTPQTTGPRQVPGQVIMPQ